MPINLKQVKLLALNKIFVIILFFLSSKLTWANMASPYSEASLVHSAIYGAKNCSVIKSITKMKTMETNLYLTEIIHGNTVLEKRIFNNLLI